MKLTKKKKIIISIVLVILFLLGIGIMVYPFASAWYAECVRSEVRYEYAEKASDEAMVEQINKLQQAANEYNSKLYSGEISPLNPEENGYWEQLQFAESEMMCYIRIPSIDVALPVYHGIGEEDLRRGAGHMPQTSLPIGGENTHCVISAHSGMAASPMFTDIGLLEEGSLVYIDILDRTLTYEVYGEHEIVLPNNISSITIQEGEDLLTLVTCTPINVNSHRLLVHCRRVEDRAQSLSDSLENTTDPNPTSEQNENASSNYGEKITESENQSIYLQAYKQNIFIGILIGLAILLLIALIVAVWRRKRETE